MFDISFAELLVIMIVGLIVLGPERLPVVARTIGHLLGRAQRYVERVKSDLRAEIELDNIRKMQNDIQDNISTFKDSLNNEMSQIRESADISSTAVSKNAGGSYTAQKTTRTEILTEAVSQPESPLADPETSEAKFPVNKNQHDA